MAKFYGKNQEIYAVRMDEQEELDYPVIGHDDETTDIDPEVNISVFEQYAQDHNNHEIIAGVLYYQGSPVTINPFGAAWLARLNKKEAKARFLLSQLVNKTPEEIYTLMQGRIDSWPSLAGARADLREWLPLMVAILAWSIQGLQDD